MASEGAPGLFLEPIWCHFGHILAAPDYEKPRYGLRLIFASKFDVCLLDNPSKNNSSLDGHSTQLATCAMTIFERPSERFKGFWFLQNI